MSYIENLSISEEPFLNRIGIMQGRLLPSIEGRIQAFPKDTWADEFPRAQAVGLQCIEWIYEVYGAVDNPLASPQGLSQMAALSRRYSVDVSSLCADYFMDKPLLRVSEAVGQERLEKLLWLLRQCSLAGIKRVVLPFVDRSEIRTDCELSTVVASLRYVLPEAERLGVELHLETSLPPLRVRDFLAQLDSPDIKVNYDIGNSAALGYDPKAEFGAYGERIGSVHVKDRLRHGSTVPLGKGDADFNYCFAALKALGYRGDFILQVARGREGEEVSWARDNRQFVLSHWAQSVETEWMGS